MASNNSKLCAFFRCHCVNRETGQISPAVNIDGQSNIWGKLSPGKTNGLLTAGFQEVNNYGNEVYVNNDFDRRASCKKTGSGMGAKRR